MTENKNPQTTHGSEQNEEKQSKTFFENICTLIFFILGFVIGYYV